MSTSVDGARRWNLGDRVIVRRRSWALQRPATVVGVIAQGKRYTIQTDGGFRPVEVAPDEILGPE